MVRQEPKPRGNVLRNEPQDTVCESDDRERVSSGASPKQYCEGNHDEDYSVHHEARPKASKSPSSSSRDNAESGARLEYSTTEDKNSGDEQLEQQFSPTTSLRRSSRSFQKQRSETSETLKRDSSDSSRHNRREDKRRGSRSGSGSATKNNSLSHDNVEILPITDEDASFILGGDGRTKRKLSRVSGAELTIKGERGQTKLEIRGPNEARERAQLYINCVMQQRVGPVHLSVDPDTRTDITIMQIPHECVGYVTGRKGQGIRSIEDEWGTLIFFTDLRRDQPGKTETLAIFSPDCRKRRGAELKVMSVVEQKLPGALTADLSGFVSDSKCFATDRVPIAEEDFSYALGKEGATRRKLARASGAILEYVGQLAFIGGLKNERDRARDYLKWLCLQRTSNVHIDDLDQRDDCALVDVPAGCVAYVTGSKGASLRRVEELSNTFIFFDGDSRGSPVERLLIFGYDAAGRRRATQLVRECIEEKLRSSTRMRQNYGNPNAYVRPPLRRYSRYSRSRSPRLTSRKYRAAPQRRLPPRGSPTATTCASLRAPQSAAEPRYYSSSHSTEKRADYKGFVSPSTYESRHRRVAHDVCYPGPHRHDESPYYSHDNAYYSSNGRSQHHSRDRSLQEKRYAERSRDLHSPSYRRSGGLSPPSAYHPARASQATASERSRHYHTSYQNASTSRQLHKTAPFGCDPRRSGY